MISTDGGLAAPLFSLHLDQFNCFDAIDEEDTDGDLIEDKPKKVPEHGPLREEPKLPAIRYRARNRRTKKNPTKHRIIKTLPGAELNHGLETYRIEEKVSLPSGPTFPSVYSVPTGMALVSLRPMKQSP